MKSNRNGQAAILSDQDYAKIRKKLLSRHHRLILDIAHYTGERWKAILYLKHSDLWDGNGKPKKLITFRAQTRKAAPSGIRQTRQVPTHPYLREVLASYEGRTGSEAYLFPSPRNSTKPLTFQAAYQFLIRAIAQAGLSAKGISTHSTRRTFITELHNKGVSLKVIQRITGHHDIQVLSQYIEVTPNVIENAIALL